MRIIKVRMKDQYDAATLPQVWDELRRKINDMQRELIKKAGEPVKRELKPIEENEAWQKFKASVR